MSTTFTALLPDGTTATRTSKTHTYTFAVAIGPEPREKVAQRISKDVAAAAAHAAVFSGAVDYLAAGGRLVHEERLFGTKWILGPDLVGFRGGNERGNFGFSRDAAEKADVEAARPRLIEEYREQAAEQVSRHATQSQLLADTLAGPALVGDWRVAGWQSRADLAAKFAESARDGAFDADGCEVLVLEATAVVKPAKAQRSSK